MVIAKLQAPEWVVHTAGRQQIVAAARYAADVSAGWFDPLRADASPVSVGGRNSAWFVQQWHGPAVLRHFRRGGWRAKLGPNSYFWQGMARVRAFAELGVLRHLQLADVAVPDPIAAIAWRRGLSYQNAILVARIAAARPLAQCFEHADARRVARAIAAMHAARVWHADLNAYNILLDDTGKVWLIDFDRARVGEVSRAQAEKNLLRLRRSLQKLEDPRALRWWDLLAQDF